MQTPSPIYESESPPDTGRETFLFLARQPPHGQTRCWEVLDMALAAAAFDRVTALAFMDDGVFQLLAGQTPERVGARDFAKTFGALTDYGINSVLVETESLIERQISTSDLIPIARAISRTELSQMIAGAKVVVG